MKMLEENLQKKGVHLNKAELEALYYKIEDLGRIRFPSENVAEVIRYGSAIVLPLLIFHAGYCDPDHRETIIWALDQIEESCWEELTFFLRYAPSYNVIKLWEGGEYDRSWKDYYNCARYTAFEALIERALKNKENRYSVLQFVTFSRDDQNPRICQGVDSAIAEINKKIRENK
jgi:hypothetical protein